MYRASWKMSRSMYYVGCLFKTLALNMKMRRTLFLPKGVVLKMFCFVHAASTHNWPKLSLEFISLSLAVLLFTLDEHNNRDKKIAGKLSPKTSQLSCFLYFQWPPQIKNVLVASKIVKASPQSKIGAQNSSFLFFWSKCLYNNV